MEKMRISEQSRGRKKGGLNKMEKRKEQKSQKSDRAAERPIGAQDGLGEEILIGRESAKKLGK